MSAPAPGPSLKTFVSYCVDDKRFVYEVCDLLGPYLGRDKMFLFEEHSSGSKNFLATLVQELVAARIVLIFVGKRYDKHMEFEGLLTAALAQTQEQKQVYVIDIGDYGAVAKFPQVVQNHLSGRQIVLDQFTKRIPAATIPCAKEIVDRLRKDPANAGLSLEWKDENLRYGLPASAQLFDYEKDMIRFYLAKRCYEKIRELKKGDDPRPLLKRFAAARKGWRRRKIEAYLRQGVPADWPRVYRYEPTRWTKESHGVAFRGGEKESLVRAAALMGLAAPGKEFSFPEAGPRARLAMPPRGQNQLKVGILVAGGIAPGINAVIDAIVQRHDEYRKAGGGGYQLDVVGVKNGLLAFDAQFTNHLRRLKPKHTADSATRGGSILGTSRDDRLLGHNSRERREQFDQIARDLNNQNFDVLYVIGGDGSMKAAHAIWHQFNGDPKRRRLSVVAVPKTMDNDILWVWQSFGFLSAVEEARKIVELLHTEVRSNPRLGIVQFFGSGSGFVVSHAVLAAATGHVMLALIPEQRFSVLGVACYLKQRLWEAAKRVPGGQDRHDDPVAPIDPSIPHGLIVMAETAIPLDAMECLKLRPAECAALQPFYDAIAASIEHTPREEAALITYENGGRRVQGQTSDDLRSLGVKILHSALKPLIKMDLGLKKDAPDDWLQAPRFNPPDWGQLRMLHNEPRYLVRALEPSTSDIINGQRLGLLAVDAAMAGYTDCMVSQWLTEFVLVPLDLVVSGRKRIPHKGMFWNSVTAKTGQPMDLVAPYPDGKAPHTSRMK